MNRRELLAFGVGCGTAGVTGGAVGYRYHRPIRQLKNLTGTGERPSQPVSEFRANAEKIWELHRKQTKETVEALKIKYEGSVLGKFRVWDLIEKLALCVDPTDTALQCTSQYMHVCQVIAGMERDDELDEEMLLAALLHDLGKVAMLAGEAPENVVCLIEPVEALEPGVGLENVIFQFGHDEIAYSRFKDHVPEHIAWMLRYHSMAVSKAEEYMSPKDHEYNKKYLAKFRKYDLGTKSTAFLPDHLTLDRYRDLVEDYFPHPILF